MADHAAVTFLLEQITEVIEGHVNLISGVDKEFKRLKDDIVELKAILEDTANTATEDKSVRLIKTHIREVIYEVEDAIDSWLTEKKGKNRFSRTATSFSFAKKLKSLREEKVKEILEKAMEMKATLQSLGNTNEIKDDDQERRIHRMGRPIRQDRIVGLQDETHKIIGYLMKDQAELDIISIVGMPGLGKTALAWRIYNDEKICYEFPIRIWVDINQSINSRYVFLQIMNHFTSQELYGMSDGELCQAVHACLSRDKFLLVMDDVWKTEDWDELKAALPYSNGRGKVLITSREMAVSRHVQQITEPHQQRFLTSDESWDLLQLEVFGRVGACPEELQEIGQQISTITCKGVPLMIVVLGGVLKYQYLRLKSDAQVKEKWMEVAQNENPALKHDMDQAIVDIVALSYHRLPERLRDCFLYLGVFPAGYEIQTWTLTRLWIAEGFIQPEQNKSLEKIAEDNLNDLISRNLLMVQKMNPMGEVKVCRVSDVVRLFCTDEAEKQNLFKEVRMSNLMASDMEMIHRLCLHSDFDRFFSAKLKGPRVRSFLCFRKDASELTQEKVSGICENYRSLRILHSKSIIFSRFPAKIINLIHLRYIVMCVPELDILPEQISQLWNLQTIIVDTNSKSLKMRASLWKIIRLRHLKTKAAIFLEKKFVDGDQGGDNLQTLSRLSPESVPEVSRNARNLNTLGIRGELAPLFQNMPLGNLNRLEKLKLYNATANENRLIMRFPDYNRFPPNLKRLTLSNTFLDWKHMFTLANIAGLEVLKLKDNAFTGIHWDASSYGFNNLEFLIIVNTDVVLWEAVPNTFPRLKHLVLKNSENLKEIPDCLLQRLESLEVERVRKFIVDSVMMFGDQLKLTVGVSCDI